MKWYRALEVGGSCVGALSGSTYKVDSVTTDCTVVAEFEEIPIVTYPIEVTVVGNGSVSPSSLGEIEEGTQFELTAIPASGWQLAGFTDSCEGGRTEGNVYRSAPVNSGCQVQVSFEAIEWLVSVSSGPNGSITPSEDLIVREGDILNFNIAPADGYRIASLQNSCGGGLIGFELTTGYIRGNCSVAVSFEPLPPVTYKITASVMGNGYLTPDLPMRLIEGESFSFRIVTQPDNRLVSIEGCHGQLDGDVYQISAINSDCRIDAQFEQYRWKTSGLDLSPTFNSLPDETPFMCTASAFSLAGKSTSDYIFQFTTASVAIVDTDSDGTPDETDNCPGLANDLQLDFDTDGQGDICDSDDDNDGTPDAGDAFPLNPDETADTDGDGIGNNADPDDDGDGYSDLEEQVSGSDPLDRNSYPDEGEFRLPIWLYFIATQPRAVQIP